MSKAPSPNVLCRCAVSMLRADSCAVQLRKPSSVSLTDWRSRLLLSATSHHVDVQLAHVKAQELTEKGTACWIFFFISRRRDKLELAKKRSSLERHKKTLKDFSRRLALKFVDAHIGKVCVACLWCLLSCESIFLDFVSTPSHTVLKITSAKLG